MSRRGRIAVFGYGSLVDPVSAARTLGRDQTPAANAAPLPAELPNWRRRWSQARDNLTCEKTFARVSNGTEPTWILGLNIERVEPDRSPGAALNGVLIELDEAELERLDIREIRYRRLEVTSEIVLDEGTDPGWDAVVTYVARPEHFAPEPPAGAVVLAAYVGAVERAFAALGESQLERYRQTTDAPPAEVVEAVLVRDRIPAGNPREW